MRRTKRPAESLDTITAAWIRDHNGKEAVTVSEAADKRVSMRDLCAYANGF